MKICYVFQTNTPEEYPVLGKIGFPGWTFIGSVISTSQKSIENFISEEVKIRNCYPIFEETLNGGNIVHKCFAYRGEAKNTYWHYVVVEDTWEI